MHKYTTLLLGMGPSDRELVLAHMLLSHADARSPSLRTVIFVSRKIPALISILNLKALFGGTWDRTYTSISTGAEQYPGCSQVSHTYKNLTLTLIIMQ
jgi:hypothetical protein